MKTLRQLNAAAKRKFRASAETIPSEVRDALIARAKEAIESGEPHKCTGGWVASPFYGQHEVLGLLEIAANALKELRLALHFPA